MASTAKVGKVGVIVTTVGGGAGETATQIKAVNGDGTVNVNQADNIPFVDEDSDPPAGATRYFKAVDYST